VCNEGLVVSLRCAHSNTSTQGIAVPAAGCYFNLHMSVDGVISSNSMMVGDSCTIGSLHECFLAQTSSKLATDLTVAGAVRACSQQCWQRGVHQNLTSMSSQTSGKHRMPRKVSAAGHPHSSLSSILLGLASAALDDTLATEQHLTAASAAAHRKVLSMLLGLVLSAAGCRTATPSHLPSLPGSRTTATPLRY